MVVPRRLLHCLSGIALAMACGLVHATNFLFGGAAVGGCSLAATTYTCASLPLSAFNDSIQIASGYTVNVQSNVYVGYNQGLKMSGTAKLATTGALDISDVQGALLQITGGTLSAAGAFTYGAQSQNITANVSAASMTLGGGATGSISGALTSSGPVAIASHMTVGGSVSGTVVSTGSPVVINASVTASTSFSLSSGSTMTGTITSPKVDLLASGVKLTGDIVSTGAVTIASGDQVVGDVTADTIVLKDSSGFIDGDVTVRAVTLGWQTRVKQKIYCSAGNTAGNCDCVTNNSGYAVNSPLGPSCPATGSSAGPHHFQVAHPVSGPTCMPSAVTVTACANAACTAPHYGGGASVTLTPGGKSFTIDATGVNSAATVEQATSGTATIATSPASAGMVCIGSGGAGATSDCKIAFTDSALVLAVPNHVADVSTSFTVAAVKSSANNASCAPAFSGSKPVAFTCSYQNPTSGTLPVLVNGTSVACNGAPQTVTLTFGAANGIAPATVKYADVGSVNLAASVASPAMNGSDNFIAAPASFSVSGPAAGNIKAGAQFAATVTARNNSNAATPNFGRETSPESVTMSLTKCSPAGSNFGTVASSVGTFSAGAATATMSWSEVGTADIGATLASGSYLSSGLSANGNTGTGGTVCNTLGNVGPFTPDHFDVAITQPIAGALGFTYSGQPFAEVSITAENLAGGTTLNYSGTVSSGPVYAKAVTLVAREVGGPTINPGPGALKSSLAAAAGAVVVPAADFSGGVAKAYPVYTFTNALTAPLTLRLRATDTDAVSSEAGVEGTALIRSGRLRLFGAFGRSSADLSMPYRTEYWTGNSWLVNTSDTNAIPASAVALSPAATMNGTTVKSVSTLVAGQGTITLKPVAPSGTTGTGVVDVAINLGTTLADLSCLAAHPASTGAAMPWLRSLNGSCAATYDRDPAARATFGVSAPEQRRVIHVREVFR